MLGGDQNMGSVKAPRSLALSIVDKVDGTQSPASHQECLFSGSNIQLSFASAVTLTRKLALTASRSSARRFSSSPLVGNSSRTFRLMRYNGAIDAMILDCLNKSLSLPCRSGLNYVGRVYCADDVRFRTFNFLPIFSLPVCVFQHRGWRIVNLNLAQLIAHYDF